MRQDIKLSEQIKELNKKFESLVEDSEFQIISGIVVFYVMTLIVLAWSTIQLWTNWRIYKPKLRLEQNYILYALCFFDIMDLLLGTLHQVLIHVYSRSDHEQCSWFGLFLNVSHNFHVLLSLIYQFNFLRRIKNPTVNNICLDIMLFGTLLALTIAFNLNATQMLCQNMEEKPLRQLQLQEVMAYVSCFWSIFVVPLFICIRMRIKRVFQKGLLQRVMAKYSALLD